ncbi:MAG: zraS 2 [Planctomycetaceae bacterium]|nr:zraS 2 [Planctomycetaceae bacterium]
MKQLRDSSIRTKLNLLGTVTAGIALCLACVTFVISDASASKAMMVEHLRTLADVLGSNCVAALTFDDPKAANDVLTSLKFEPTILAGGVYDHNGLPFATYGSTSPKLALSPGTAANPGHVFENDGTLKIIASIRDNNEEIGMVVLKAGMAPINARFQQQILMAAVVLFVSVVIAFLFSSFLQKFVSVPIMNLAKTAEHISLERDFSIRVEKMADDEIGSLYTAFNRMLERIEVGEADLRRSYDELELRVQRRTVQLSEANEILSHEVTERKRAEEDLRELQSQHLDAARRAGMAEIATSVLHNVGNVLNSVNTSASIIRDKLKKFGTADFQAATDLLKQHLEDPGPFVTSDSRGKYLPKFLIQLSQKMSSEELQVLEELKSLSKSIDHIKGIVSVQQSYAGGAGFLEELPLASLVEDAIRINGQSLSRHNVEVIREFEDLPPIHTDKQKVLQILVNLVSNAKHAVVETNQPNPQLKVRILRTNADHVRVEVVDNGIGIQPENLTRIFSHGFTTRKDGHGFGLHSAANLAREMGGSLTVDSEGQGQGAKFILELATGSRQRKQS